MGGFYPVLHFPHEKCQPIEPRFGAGGLAQILFMHLLKYGRPGHDVVLADLTSFGTRRIT
jgi:hypothetical protein